jgi:CRP/FNR family cyclic AMP-dependent transcriptional regulator
MPESSERRRELLQKVPLFAGLAPDRVGALAAAATTRRLATRETLFHRGDVASQVYVVASGRLKVVARSREGDEVLLAIVDEGEVVGELPLLTGGRRTATVIALESSELVSLGRREFLRFLREQPEAAVELMVVLAERLIRINDFVEDTLFLALPARLAKKVLHLVERYGIDEEGESRIDLRLSQTELAEWVGASRESVNKQIRAWSGEGVLRMRQGEIRVLDLERLERLAGLVGS